MVGRGMTIVGTLMVGGGGGSVGSGGGMNVFVGGTDVRVAGKDVRVGLTRVEVGASVETPVAVRPAWGVRGVAVGGNVAVRVGVRVADGVGVGIVEVALGISEGVCVGTVEVGKGPSSASDVRASAVLVPAAPPKAPASRPVPRKASRIQRIAASKKASSPTVRRLDRFAVKFNSWFPSRAKLRVRSWWFSRYSGRRHARARGPG